jgi:hypothetical protein
VIERWTLADLEGSYPLCGFNLPERITILIKWCYRRAPIIDLKGPFAPNAIV